MLADGLADHFLVDRAGGCADALALVKEAVCGEVNAGGLYAHLVDPPTLVDRVVGYTRVRQLLTLLNAYNAPLERAIGLAAGQFQPGRPRRLTPHLDQLDVGRRVRTLLLHL